MGELVTYGLKHAHDVVVDELNKVDAKEVYACTDILEVVRAHRREPLSNRKHETWYIAESSSPRHKGVLYIGVILMAPDMRRSVELKKTTDLVYVATSGREVSTDDESVQVWGRKVMDAASGVAYYNCPLEFLDQTEPTTDAERRWREEVRRRAEARAG